MLSELQISTSRRYKGYNTNYLITFVEGFKRRHFPDLDSEKLQQDLNKIVGDSAVKTSEDIYWEVCEIDKALGGEISKINDRLNELGYYCHLAKGKVRCPLRRF